MGHQIFKTDNDVGTVMKQWMQEKENYFFKEETVNTYPTICVMPQSPRKLKEKQFIYYHLCCKLNETLITYFLTVPHTTGSRSGS